VNLAPADVRKVGPVFDLAIAIGLLSASGQIPPESTAGYALCGELSLTGALRPIRGALAVALGARQAEVPRLSMPAESASEAALIDEVQAIAVPDLERIVRCSAGSGMGFRGSLPRRSMSSTARGRSTSPTFVASTMPSGRSRLPPPAVTTF
jgi:magnesium chelatase family protein